MSDIAWFALCISAGLALDWALLDQITTTLEVLLKRLPSRGYVNTLFPRIVATLLSLVAVAYGTMSDSSPEVALYLGIAMFLLSLSYGVITRFPKNRDLE